MSPKPPAFRILVVDDNPDESSVYGWYLEKVADCEVKLDFAETGAQGLKKLASGPYDFVILDYQMPGMSGIEVLTRMRQSGMETPVVIMTGVASEKVAVESLKMGALDYILKEDLPRLDFTGLLRRVREVSRLRDENRDLERLNDLKNAFLDRLEQYIRRPVVTTFGVLDMLLKERMGSLNSLQKESLSTIQKEAQHLFDLVEDLINLQMLTLKVKDLKRRRISLTALARERLEVLRRSWEEKGMTCETSLPDDPLEVDADPDKLVVILDNLLSNAVRFTPYGGRIGVIIKRRSGDRAELVVADTGEGLTAEQRARLFEMPSADRPLPERLGGLGLGLAVSRRIAEAHGASLQVESEGPDKGTAVTLILPLSSKTAPAAPSTKP